MANTESMEAHQGSSVATEAVQVVTSITPAPAAKMTLAAVQAKLAGQTGKRFWKNLEELSATQEFNDMLGEEFPRQAGEWTDAVSRRGFLKVMGASFALAGLSGCTKQPDEPIYPYVKQPEDLVLGRPMYFATAHPFPTGAIPVLVKSDAFRPIKIEGNPDHPMSKGKSDAYTQATLLDLYDPDRSHTVRFRGQDGEFGKFQDSLLKAVKASQGQGVYFLSETITSPTLATQWKSVQAAYPGTKLIQWEPINQDSSRAASKAAFGSYTDAQYKLEDADVILSLDADFLGGIAHPGFLPLASAYAERHRFEKDKTMNRLYVVESMPTVTGFKAEHRLALKPSEIAVFAEALASGGSGSFSNPDASVFLTKLLADLKASGGKGVVIPGEGASAAVHAAAYKLNASLGAVGKTVIYTETVNPLPTEQLADLKSLVADMNAGKVQFLVLLGVNPLYTAPKDLNFADALGKVTTTASLSTHVDETASITTWHINKTHYLESWTDARTYDGTITVIQPMIAPLYDGKSSHDIIQGLLENPQNSAYDAVVANAKTYIKGDFPTAWRKTLHDGWVEGTAFAATSKTPSAGTATPSAPATATAGLEIAFKHDPSIYDGRYANVGWLQELPKQVTSLSWDNAALVSLNTQQKLGIAENDAVEIELNGRKVVAPILMVPGHPDDVVTVYLGHGRSEAGRVGSGVGFDAYTLRTSDAPLVAFGAQITRGKGTYDLCVTKVHSIEHRGTYAQHDLEQSLDDKKGTYSLPGHEAEERGIIRYATVTEAKANPDFAHDGNVSGTKVNKVGYGPEGEKPEHDNSFFPDAWKYDHPDQSTLRVQNAWGMSIDLNSCIGCNACIVSCYAENNIPVVGREQVKVGRNMQWLRIDTYFEGDLHAPKAHFQPMACQHCENAGCEQVCPVGATVHTPEGINTMVYNRCVGTRYCSNNCPYKVRRFNFLLYSDYDTESLKFMRNPDVSVRSRGVMEKCSYCIQRIEAVKIEADKDNRAIKDGDIVTACQQACPTDAIIFGNQNDPTSKVAKRKAEERDYQVLADLNFRPRTSYMAGVINPNPELA
ncbi:TAT-variant-translocated molybdopterin oxidoreductase [Granulicella tundricola]|nr:TAT-variant-translocated molybdopterin oxidoreductase [Granulicella tundricola]